MTFNDYEIKEVTPENSFLGELIEKTYWLGSAHGFILGEMQRVIEQADKRNLDMARELDELYLGVNNLLTQYSEIHEFIGKEWNIRGKPESLRQQQIEKKNADERDAKKAEYYDR